MSSEPDIIINGQKLSTAEAMTVRLAIEILSVEIHSEHEDNEHHAIMRAYSHSVETIRDKILEG